MYRVLLDTVKCSTLDVARKIWEDINSPVALSCYMLSFGGPDELTQLVGKSLIPSHYRTASEYADDALAVSLLSKFPDFSLSVDPEEAAKEKFFAAEQQCKETNFRFRRFLDDPSKTDPMVVLSLERARRKIIEVLGRPRVQDIARRCGFGPGVSSSVKGSGTSTYNKLQGKPEATPLLIGAGVHHLVNAHSPWASTLLDAQGEDGLSRPVSILQSGVSAVQGNSITFVPKNAKTHRAIAIEPHLNVFYQKGVGKVLRHKLYRAGQDLDDQKRNQKAAYRGSKYNHLATIDLSSASDTVSVELVRFLLPEDWFHILWVGRSEYGYLDGKWLRYHKFSSMGNGYTFELETLLFFSLAWALCDLRGIATEEIEVYGDDIIVPVDAFDELLELLRFCGFTANSKKSFGRDSPFRESCGQDFFAGTLVRPFFMKEEIKDAQNVYRVANALRRYSARRCSGLGCDGRFRSTWNYLLHRVPRTLRFAIPDGFGDGGFVKNFDEAVPTVVRVGILKRGPRRGVSRPPVRSTREVTLGPVRARGGLEGFSFQSLVEKPVKGEMQRVLPAVAAMLWNVGSESPLSGKFSHRRRTTVQIGPTIASTWPNLGPWY